MECFGNSILSAYPKRTIVALPKSPDNLFTDLPRELPEELIENLFQTENVRIERIVSTGQSSPEGFWYDQEETEWVILLRGEATLEFPEKPRLRRLRPGDYVLIPAHQKHRVYATSTSKTTVWLAVFTNTPTQGVLSCKSK